MSRHRHDIRRLAMQLLFQLDVRGIEDSDNIQAALAAAGHEPQLHDEAFALAMGAWQTHSESDELVTTIAPDWPSYRQPPVDRAILRLAYHEITTGRVPVKIAINEAVELAKQFAGEESAPFVNGVLDKMHRQLRDEGKVPEPKPQPQDGDAWLADAINPSPKKNELGTRNS